MAKPIEFFTFEQLQKRWNCCYRTVRKILARERIPVIALSINGTATFRIPARAILQLEKRFEKRRENSIPVPIA